VAALVAILGTIGGLLALAVAATICFMYALNSYMKRLLDQNFLAMKFSTRNLSYA
jgi:hypothetical protein